jgi:hypothetical protein
MNDIYFIRLIVKLFKHFLSRIYFKFWIDQIFTLLLSSALQ